MKKPLNPKLLWFVAIALTFSSAAYQRMTGPTYPVRVEGELVGAPVQARLLTSHSVSTDLPVVVAAVILLAVYMIPHSALGSTLDYKTMQTVTG